MRATAGGRAALALTVANLGGAAFNYLFQVHAAKVLDAAAFGTLSAWLAWVTLAGLVATVVQFVSLDHRLPEGRWQTLVRVAGAISAVVFALHLVLGARLPQAVLGTTAIAGGILLYALIGQLQARLELGTMAVSVMVATALRFALPFAWPRIGRAPAFYVAHAAASFAAVVAVAAIDARAARRRPAEPAEAPERPAPASARAAGDRLRLRRPMLLAFATVLFPIVDVLVVSSTQDAATTGAFSRLALAARVVFFFGAAALQILLPHQLRARSTGAAMPPFVSHLERWLTPAALVGAALFALLLDRVVLRPTGPEQTWMFASCFSSALLVAVLGHVNWFAARDDLRVAAGLVGGIVMARVLAVALAASVAPGDRARVTYYVVGAVAGDVLVLLASSVAQKRSRSAAGLR